MVVDIIHTVKYVIKFKNPVDYFDIVLQKQIDARFKFANGTSEEICVIDLTFDRRFLDSEYMKKYSELFLSRDLNLRYNFLELNNSHDKYSIIEKLFKDLSLYNNPLSKYYLNEYHDVFKKCKKTSVTIRDLKKMDDKDEFSHCIETMLEEFHFFLNTFQFTDEEKKFINSIVMDDKIKSNIEFAGWIDEWMHT